MCVYACTNSTCSVFLRYCVQGFVPWGPWGPMGPTGAKVSTIMTCKSLHSLHDKPFPHPTESLTYFFIQYSLTHWRCKIKPLAPSRWRAGGDRALDRQLTRKGKSPSPQACQDGTKKRLQPSFQLWVPLTQPGRSDVPWEKPCVVRLLFFASRDCSICHWLCAVQL